MRSATSATPGQAATAGGATMTFKSIPQGRGDLGLERDRRRGRRPAARCNCERLATVAVGSFDDTQFPRRRARHDGPIRRRAQALCGEEARRSVGERF